MSSKRISRSEFLGSVLGFGGTLEAAVQAVGTQAGKGGNAIGVYYGLMDKLDQEVPFGKISSVDNSFEEAKKLGSALKSALEAAIDFSKAPLGLRVSAVKNAKGVYIKVCFPKAKNLI